MEPRGYDDFSYAGRHLWKFEKTVQNAASDGFGSNFSGAAFCLPHQLVSFLFSFPSSRKSIWSIPLPVCARCRIAFRHVRPTRPAPAPPTPLPRPGTALTPKPYPTPTSIAPPSERDRNICSEWCVIRQIRTRLVTASAAPAHKRNSDCNGAKRKRQPL